MVEIDQFCADHDMCEIIRAPTHRFWNDNVLKENQIDHISTSDKLCFSQSIDCDFSDHNLIYLLKVKREVAKNSYITRRSFRNFDPIAFHVRLTAMLSFGMFSFEGIYNINTVITLFNEQFCKLQNEFCPLFKVRKRTNQCKYIDKGMKEKVKLKNKLYRRYIDLVKKTIHGNELKPK